MWFYILNAICWIIVFYCFYLILNPKLISPKFNISPYKLMQKDDMKNSFNVIESLKYLKQDKLIKISKSFKNNFDIIVFNFNGSLNVGNIMRLSAIYGADNYFIIGRKIYDSRSCVGSDKYVNIKCIKNIVKMLPNKYCKPEINYQKFRELLIDNNLAPVFIEQGGTNICKFNFGTYFKCVKNKPVFIFGNETYGIDKDLIKHCNDLEGFQILSIPQCGVLKSLNVSNSASIVLWELYRSYLSKNDIINKYDL